MASQGHAQGIGKSETLSIALSLALAVLDRHAARAQLALAPVGDTHLGDIELPEPLTGASGHMELLEPVGPFYLAFQLELAGLLHTADTIASLFGSGAITEPLGETAALLAEYWRDRHKRLTEAERLDLFRRVFEQPYFDRLLRTLSVAIVQQGDPANDGDIRTSVQVEEAAQQLVELLTERGGGMTSFAAQEVIENINSAVRFMKDRQLQAAFGVSGGLWSLVRAGTPPASDGRDTIQAHVDLGSSGQEILRWLTREAQAGTFRLNRTDPGYAALIANAQRWVMADSLLSQGHEPEAPATAAQPSSAAA